MERNQAFGKRKGTMKTASAIIQVIALTACFAVQASLIDELKMNGITRAMRTLAAAGCPASLSLEHAKGLNLQAASSAP